MPVTGMPRTAILLSAGYGRRMLPLTEQTAKPLLVVGGQSLLDHALDRLGAAGVETVVVNAHWHADQVEQRLRARGARRPGPPQTIALREPELLETGGGVRAALEAGLLDHEAPFFVVNGDSFWLEGPCPALRRLADAFDPDRLDAMLLVSRVVSAVGDVGRKDFSGDFAVDPDGLVRRRQEHEIVPYVYAGVQIVSRRLFDRAAPEVFSMNLLWDRAIRAKRLRALVHDGPWFHLSRPADIAAAGKAMRDPVFGPPGQ
jgi:N-acetyl-alpha-D-muramate 1-phosphate uridylyltransferase